MWIAVLWIFLISWERVLSNFRSAYIYQSSCKTLYGVVSEQAEERGDCSTTHS